MNEKDKKVIKDIIELCRLYKKYYHYSYVRISDIVKELGMTEFYYLKLIDKYSEHFSLYYDNNGKVAIQNVYLNPSDNPESIEWQNKKAIEWQNKLYVTRIPTGNESIMILEDTPNNSLCNLNEYKWRNTLEKLKRTGLVLETFEMTYEAPYKYITVNAKHIQYLIDNGWLITDKSY